jgi:hypothetical protein
MTLFLDTVPRHDRILPAKTPRVTTADNSNDFYFFEQSSEITKPDAKAAPASDVPSEKIHILTRWGHFRRRRSTVKDFPIGEGPILFHRNFIQPNYPHRDYLERQIAENRHSAAAQLVYTAYRSFCENEPDLAKQVRFVWIGENSRWNEKSCRGCFGVEIDYSIAKYPSQDSPVETIYADIHLIGNTKGQIAIDTYEGWTKDPAIVHDMIRHHALQVRAYNAMQSSQQKDLPFFTERLPEKLADVIAAAAVGQYYNTPFEATFAIRRPPAPTPGELVRKSRAATK